MQHHFPDSSPNPGKMTQPLLVRQLNLINYKNHSNCYISKDIVHCTKTYAKMLIIKKY